MPSKHEVVGLWSAFMRPFGFYAIAHESIFLLYRKKQWHWYFFCHIGRMQATSIASNDDTRQSYFSVVSRWVNNNNTIFYCIGRASKRASNDHMVLQRASQCSRRIVRTNNNNFVFYVISRVKQWQEYFLHFVLRIARSNGDERIFYVISLKAMMQLHERACLSLQGCKRLAAIMIPDCRSQEQWLWLYFLHGIATSKRRRLHFLDRSRGSKQISSVKINGINQVMIIPLYCLLNNL